MNKSRNKKVLQHEHSHLTKLVSETDYVQAMEQLVTVVQELSLARDLDTIMRIVRNAARELTGADGATFVLRDNGMCYYAEENAISPLWKGQRFPMTSCISGWAMLNRQHAVIEDIYSDSRIPHDAYRPTFVKSLTMVPIRKLDPIGAIGNYWAGCHLANPNEVKLLQALADTTAVAMENIQVYAELEQRVRNRTAELESANRELEAFSYSVSHDLRAPLRHIEGFSRTLTEDYIDRLDEKGIYYLERIRLNIQHMDQLIDDMLYLSRVSSTDMHFQTVDLSSIAEKLMSNLASAEPDRHADISIQSGLVAKGDPNLLEIALANLLSNAWKFTGKNKNARIEIGSQIINGRHTFLVKDNGAGFNMKYADRLFGVFQRFHKDSEFPGTGIGLATVKRILNRHNGKIWVDSAENKGTTFYFELPQAEHLV